MCAAFTTGTPAPETPEHIPVLLAEVIDALAPKDGGVYLDGTFGAGGYTTALLEAAPCVVWCIDRDPEALARGEALATRYPGRVNLVQGRGEEAGVALVRHPQVKLVSFTGSAAVSGAVMKRPAARQTTASACDDNPWEMCGIQILLC